MSLQEGMLEGKKAQGFSTFSVGAVYVCHSHQFVSNLHQVKLLNFFFLLFFFFSPSPVAVDRQCALFVIG